MPTQSLRYDHCNHLVRRELPIVPTAGATTEFGKTRHFQAMRLKSAHAVVTTAGTSTAHGYDVYSGTTSVGSITLGTNTAGYKASVDLGDIDVAAQDSMSVKSLADATGVAEIQLEFETDKAALVTK